MCNCNSSLINSSQEDLFARGPSLNIKTSTSTRSPGKSFHAQTTTSTRYVQGGNHVAMHMSSLEPMRRPEGGRGRAQCLLRWSLKDPRTRGEAEGTTTARRSSPCQCTTQSIHTTTPGLKVSWQAPRTTSVAGRETPADRQRAGPLLSAPSPNLNLNNLSISISISSIAGRRLAPCEARVSKGD